LMTLVDEERQHQLSEHLSDHLVTAKRASGGSAANTIIAASRFGAPAFYSCKVAADDNGDFYLRDLEVAGVEHNWNSPREEGITGRCLVLISPDAERSMNSFLGISESLSVAQLVPTAIESSAYVYIEGYLVTSPTGRAAAIQTRETAQAAGVKTALSLSDPGMVEFFKDGLQEMLGDKGVDLLFCNELEAKTWSGSEDMDATIVALKQVAGSFAITLGARGALIYDGESLIEIEPHQVQAIDSNGAGDMFAGAFLYALGAGHDHSHSECRRRCPRRTE
jgi:sugar/nucleoside kinase (ribokinase family)